MNGCRICLLVCIALMLSKPAFTEEARKEEWVAKASDKIKDALKDGDAKDEMAKAILKYTHHSGSSPKIDSIETAKSLDDQSTLITTFTLKWKGGLTHAKYTTVITWKCNQTKHITATVSKDDALTSVSDENKLKLDKHFSEWFDKLFPPKPRE